MVHTIDDPTYGAFGGVRFGKQADGVSLELGVFRDRSALGLRKGTIVWVPSITVGGDVFRALSPGRGYSSNSKTRED